MKTNENPNEDSNEHSTLKYKQNTENTTEIYINSYKKSEKIGIVFGHFYIFRPPDGHFDPKIGLIGLKRSNLV